MNEGDREMAFIASFIALMMGGTILVLAIIAYPWLIAAIIMIFLGVLLGWAALEDAQTEDDLSDELYRGRRINE